MSRFGATSSKKPYQPKPLKNAEDDGLNEFQRMQQRMSSKNSKWAVLDSKRDALKKLAEEEKERLRKLEELKNAMQHVDTKEMDFNDEETRRALEEKRRLEEEERLRMIREEEEFNSF
eukprot:sb/3476374/